MGGDEQEDEDEEDADDDVDDGEDDEDNECDYEDSTITLYPTYNCQSHLLP